MVTLFVQLIAHYYIECANVTDPAIKEVKIETLFSIGTIWSSKNLVLNIAEQGQALELKKSN